MLPNDEISKILDKKVTEKIYDDVFSNSGKEISKIGVDLVKTARLLLVPLQITAAFQDRFEKLIERIKTRIPEEQYIEAPAEIVGPAIEKMRFLDDKSLLWQMFEELLTRSVDKLEASKSHPAFVHIISQLSRDEAFILFKLKTTDFEIIDTMDLNEDGSKFENRRFEKSDIPSAELFLPEMINLYYSHLESLSLVTWPVNKQEVIKNALGFQTGIRRYTKMHLTEFGKLFVSVCIPQKGFTNF
jgi:hypothetical protein